MVLLVASRSKALAVKPTVVPIDHILIDCIGRRIAVGGRRNIELIQIVDGDREVLAWPLSHHWCWPAP